MKFLCDEMLKGLARWLRAAGYDTEVADNGEADRAVLARAVAQGRLLLTRDRKMVERRAAKDAVVLLECNGTQECALVLKQQLGLDWLRRPFSRCMVCNTPIHIAPGERWAEVPPGARARGGELYECPACNRLYWEGHHVKRMRRELQRWAGGDE